jgi:hypothetical protein
LTPDVKRDVVSKYLKDFQQFMGFLNTDNNKKLIFTKNKNDRAKLRKIGENKLTVDDILSQIPTKTPNKLLQVIRDNYLKDDSPFTVFETYEEIEKQRRTPSKKPTEPPVLSPTERLDDEIAKTKTLIETLKVQLEKTTDETDKNNILSDLSDAQTNLSKLQKEKEEDSKLMGNVLTKVAEIEKKKEKEDEKEKEPRRRPPRMDEPPPRTTPPAPEAPAAPAAPPAAPPINTFDELPTPPPSPRTATATATKQDEEKGRPQDPTAIDTMQPLPSKSDLIPEARLGTKGKDINDLIDDIKYFMDNFEGQLKREKGFFKNVDIRNIKELRELHDRIVGKLAPEKRKSTDGNKVGIIVNADDYIREQMKKILQEQTFSSLRPADVVIDVGSRAVEGRDAKDFGDFEVKRTIDGGLSSQREAVYRYMPNENDRGEEALTMKKKSNRIKMPKPGLNNKRTTAIRMNTRNPFRGSQNTIKLKYLY